MIALCVPGASFLAMHGSQAEMYGSQPEMYVQGNFGYSFSGKASAEHSGETKIFDKNGKRIPDHVLKAVLGEDYSMLKRPKHDFEISPSGSITGSGSAGMMFRKGLAAELEIAYYQMKQDKGEDFRPDQGGDEESLYHKDLDLEAKYRNVLMMANLIYNVPTEGKLTPYIGGGLGVNFVKFSSSYIDNRKIGPDDDIEKIVFDKFKSKSKMALAAQGILGLAYKLTDKIDITTDYRMTWTGGSITGKFERTRYTSSGVSNETADKLVTDIPMAHRLQAGIRFRF